MGARGGQPHYPALTGVRGIAALGVVIYHLAYLRLPDTLSVHVVPGYLAVDLFFVLSGFLMAMVYGPAFARLPLWTAHRRFLWRRFARIYPVYILLTIAAFLIGLTPYLERHTAADLLASASLLSETGVRALVPATGQLVLGNAWSISTEVAAYLLFPLLLAAAVRGRWPWAMLAVLVCAAVLMWVALAGGVRGPLDVSRDVTSLRPVARCLAEFTAGLVAFRVWHGWSPARARSSLVDGAIVVGLLAALAWPGADLLFVALLPFFIARLACEGSALSRLFGWRPVFLLGEWSYSVYLVQAPSLRVVDVLDKHLGGRIGGYEHLLASGFDLLLDIAMAWALFELVEKPSRTALARWVEGRRPPPIDDEPAAP